MIYTIKVGYIPDSYSCIIQFGIPNDTTQNISVGNVIWIHEDILNVELVINKTTPEGIRILEMIRDKVDKKEIEAYYFSIILSNLDYTALLEHIRNSKDKSYNEGVADGKSMIREQFWKVMADE